MKRVKIWVNTTGFPYPLKFSKHNLYIKHNIINGGEWRDKKGGRVSMLH